MDKIGFMTEDGEQIEFYVIEQTRISGTDYILVSDSEAGDGDAFIFKDTSKEDEADAIYEVVEEETELKVVADVFANMLDDVEFI